jgi:hypothetical protein
MADSKNYLNVPYAEKDAAKALGARWDAANKKWYVPSDKDLAPFAKWHSEGPPSSSVSRSSKISKPIVSAKNNDTSDAGGGIITQATIKDFVAYDGDTPPWE